MPVGVPKVPFQNPEDEDATWVDLYHRLSRERLIFLGQAIKSRIANQIAGLMIYLSLEDSSLDLFLFINSPGGWMIDGVLIFDTIDFVKPDVNTVCFGVAVSMASFVLAGGTFTKRLAFPHGRVMIHQPLADLADSNTIEMTWDGEELLRLRNLIAHTYASRTGKPIWIISEDMERDVFMSATEAHDYGIVDLVATEDNVDEISDGLDLLAHDLRLEVGDRSLVAHDPDLVAHDFGLVETDDDISDTDFW